MKLIKSLGLPVVAAIALAGCSGYRGTDPTAVETRVSTEAVAPQGTTAANVVMGSRSGTVEVAADWMVGANNLDIYATTADCFDFTTSVVAVSSCLRLAQAAGDTAKPERLSFSGTAGASYKVWVVNRGAQADTVTLTVNIR